MKHEKPIVWPWTPAPTITPKNVSVSVPIEGKMAEAQSYFREKLREDLFRPNAFFSRLSCRKQRFTRTRRGFKITALGLPRFRGGKKIKVPFMYGMRGGGGGSFYSLDEV